MNLGVIFSMQRAKSYSDSNVGCCNLTFRSPKSRLEDDVFVEPRFIRKKRHQWTIGFMCFKKLRAVIRARHCDRCAKIYTQFEFQPNPIRGSKVSILQYKALYKIFPFSPVFTYFCTKVVMKRAQKWVSLDFLH